MDSFEALKKVMKDEKITQTKLATMIGAKGQSVIAQRLRKDGISVNNFVEMMEAMGYEVRVSKKKPGPKPAGDIVIEMTEKFKRGKNKTE